MYYIEHVQEVSAPVEKVWEFIKTPLNLNQITPEELRFEFLGAVPEAMYPGLIIRYRLRIPFFGKWEWVTEVKHIREGISFVDEQRSGPYKFWYHYHEVAKTPMGTKILDRVFYEMPYWIFGNAVHYLFVRKQLDHIFSYRWNRFEEIFNSPR